MISGRKSQITLFIIIGLVVLIIFSAVLYFTTKEKGRTYEIEKKKILEQAPNQLKPIIIYIDECVKEVSQKAIEKLGRHGGWISLSPSEYNANYNFNFDYDVVNSDGVTFDLGSNFKIPYWFYLKSKNRCVNCNFFSLKPPIDIVEKQIKGYIEENLDSCLADFGRFRDQGYDFEKTGELSANVKIRKNDVIIDVSYPHKLTFMGSEFDFPEKFTIIQDVDLFGVYDLANDITDFEIQKGFLEYIIMNWINMYGGLDSEKLPPMYEFEIGPPSVFWSLFKSTQLIKEIIAQYAHLITIYNTRNFHPVLFKDRSKNMFKRLQQGAYLNLVNKISDKNYLKFNVNFIYLPKWPVYVNIYPREGDIIRPEDQNTNFPGFFALFASKYKFIYDFAVPFVIEIRDPLAFNGQGYSFFIALEANVRASESLLDAIKGQQLPAFNIKTTPNLFNSPIQKVSGIINIYTTDEEGNPLSDVSVRYICGEDVAYIGMTHNGTLKAKFPICYNGVVRYDKMDYLGFQEIFTSAVAENGHLNAVLHKKKKIKASVMVRDIEALDALKQKAYGSMSYEDYVKAVSNAHEIRNATILLSLNRIQENPNDVVFSQVAMYNDEKQMNEISLVSGKYTVDIFYLDKNGFYIPKTIKKIDNGTDFFKDAIMKAFGVGTKKIEMPEINMSEAPLGGAVLNPDINFPFIVKNEDLDKSKELIFYAIKDTPPKTHEELGKIGSSRYDISKEYSSLIIPQWVKK